MSYTSDAAIHCASPESITYLHVGQLVVVSNCHCFWMKRVMKTSSLLLSPGRDAQLSAFTR